MSATAALPRLTLVLGGARSGKSRFAERLVESQPNACVDGACVYLATAEARDPEMAGRIADHRARRGNRWRTVEAPLDLVAGLRDNAAADRAVLVDCLTLWLANLFDAGRDVDAETAHLTDALPALAGPVVMVSNEVGLGIVPDNALSRAFRDAAGRLNQAIAAAAQSVVFIAAGLPLPLKSPEAPEARP